MAEWTRIVNTTIHKYIREVEVNILRNRKLLAMLKEKGRITFGHSGDLLDWKVRFRRVPMVGYADMDTLTFQRENRWKTAQLDWRGYAATDAMTKRERLINANTEAIVKVYSEIATNLAEDMEDQFGDELYIDGNATGNSKRIHGLESFLGDTSALLYTNGPVYTPSDSYAGLSTVLGNYGGTWSKTGGNNDWPAGTGSAEYDFWTPTIVSTTSSFWTGSATDWKSSCTTQLRYGINKGRRNRSLRGQLDLVMMENELYRQLEEKIASSERLVITRNEDTGLWKLGFRDVINFEGIDHTSEYGVPTGLAYGICTDALELCSLQKQLFVPEGPDFDPASQTYRFSIDYYGNLRTKSPRNFIKWK